MDAELLRIDFNAGERRIQIRRETDFAAVGEHGNPLRHPDAALIEHPQHSSAPRKRQRENSGESIRTVLIDISADARTFHASNGQISLDARNATFRAVTPGCEALILPAGKQGKGGFLTVDNKVGRGVFSAISLDGRPLPEAKRTLLLHLTDTQASKTKYNSPAMKQLEAWGQPPYLAARGEAELTLNVAPDGSYQLYALDTAGKRTGEIPFTRIDGRTIRFPAKVFGPHGTTLAYELVRK